MKKILCDHLRIFHLAFWLGFMLVVFLLSQSQGGRPSMAAAEIISFDFQGNFVNLRGPDILPSLGGNTFTGNFGGDFTFIGSGTGDMSFYRAEPGFAQMDVWVPALNKTSDVIAFQGIGVTRPFDLRVVNATFDSIDLFSTSNPGPAKGPCFTIAPACTGGPVSTAFSLNEGFIGFQDNTGNALSTSQSLSEVQQAINRGTSSFPDQHTIGLTVHNTFTGSFSEYGGILSNILPSGTFVSQITGQPIGKVAAAEPGTLLLVGSGLAGFAAWRRK
jgi:hypothetical protein